MKRLESQLREVKKDCMQLQAEKSRLAAENARLVETTVAAQSGKDKIAQAESKLAEDLLEARRELAKMIVQVDIAHEKVAAAHRRAVNEAEAAADAARRQGLVAQEKLTKEVRCMRALCPGPPAAAYAYG